MWKTSVWRLGSFAQALIRPAARVPLDWKTSVWRLGSFAQAVISARLNVEDFGLAVGLLRASAHPTCLARAPRLLRASGHFSVEGTGLAVGLLRASAHPTCLTGALRLGQCGRDRRGHSHSMVLGGLEEMS